MSQARERFLARIHANIAAHGFHVTVTGGDRELPRYAYTIGLSPTAGHELVLAGAVALLVDDVGRVLARAAEHVRSGDGAAGFAVPELGAFELRPVDDTWARALLLGIFDVYRGEQVPVRQVVPPADLWTLDVPDLARAWGPGREPVWRFAHEPWDLPVPPQAKAVTDLGALRGEPISEVARWEDDTWEMFAGEGPAIPAEEVRVVPLGGLVGFDPTLRPVLDLPLEQGLRREPPGPWRPWP